MWTIINLILFVIYLLMFRNILSGLYLDKRVLSVPDMHGYDYIMNPMMLFVIFIIISGPFMFYPFALVKYGVFFIVLIYMLLSAKIKMPGNIITITYGLFFAWLIICAILSAHYKEAGIALIKYAIPIFSLALGYSAIENKYDLWYALKFIAIASVLYVVICGGISVKLTPWLYYTFSRFILTYAGMTDFLSALSVIPLLIWWWSGNPRWLFAYIVIFLSPVLESVRTGIGAMTIALIVFCLLRYKFKSLPFIGLIAVLFISVILYVPEVYVKFFGEDKIVTADAIINDNALALDKINTSGRTYMWEITEDALYKGHEIIGSGLGATTSSVKEWFKKGMLSAGLLHNDYIQIKCDTGLIGLGLFIIFGVVCFLYIGKRIWSTSDMTTRISGTLALASLGSIGFSMGFDNVVSHSMSSMILPFIFIGFFLKLSQQKEEEFIIEEDSRG